MRANTDRTQDGIEVYRDRVSVLVDEYIDTLNDPEQLYNPQTAYFNGLIKYIHNNYFKRIKLDYSDIDNLDDIWDMYTSLCYKFNRYPTMIDYSMLIGISRDTIRTWIQGEYRAYKYYTVDGEEIRDFAAWRLNHRDAEFVKKPSSAHSTTAKKWMAECENALLRGAAEGNKVGCIFMLKANYGYTETAPVPAINPHQQALAVAELPKLGALNRAEIPENSLPDSSADGG